ncbi:MAG: hypothetical protein P9L92_18940 [Candidatus Electryonea clarkiae]|nr:hypothetical protein [Candidatus Electryonea clarkiae]MDP8285706.1 hypothetical protein [Candidatus Electryonea clarkiae]
MKVKWICTIVIAIVLVAVFIAGAWEDESWLADDPAVDVGHYHITAPSTDDALGKIYFGDLTGGDIQSVDASIIIEIDGETEADWTRDPNGPQLHTFEDIDWVADPGDNDIFYRLDDDGGTEGSVGYSIIIPCNP